MLINFVASGLLSHSPCAPLELHYKTCFPLIFLCNLQTWYPYYQKILPKGDSQPVMTEQLFIGSLHEHGNLLRVNIAEDKMKDIVRLSLSETHVSQRLISGVYASLTHI